MRSTFPTIALLSVGSVLLVQPALGTIVITSVTPYDYHNGLKVAVYETLNREVTANDENQITCSFTGWIYTKPAIGSRLFDIGITVNGAVYHSYTYVAPTAKTIDPNALYYNVVPESSLNYGTNTVVFYGGPFYSVQSNGNKVVQQSSDSWKVTLTVVRS